MVWTLGWVLVASLAADHLATAGGGAALFNLMVTIVGIVFGSLMAFRFYPRKPDLKSTRPSPPEPWYRRAFGWFAATVWCAVGAVWNLATFGTLARSAIHGQSLNFVILIPFSLAGLFLLLFLFVGITLVMDTVVRLGYVTPPFTPAVSVRERPAPPSAPPDKTVPDDFLKKSPVLGTLLFLSVLNWFVSAGISIHLGGDAVGILPSRDGFVVKSHGHHTAVSESAWVFSLYYSTATLLLTPLIWLLFAARAFGRRWMEAKGLMKWFIIAFLLVWFVGWYSGIGGSFLHSLKDWQKLKHPAPASEPLRQTPEAATDVQQ